MGKIEEWAFIGVYVDRAPVHCLLSVFNKKHKTVEINVNANLKKLDSSSDLVGSGPRKAIQRSAIGVSHYI